MSIKSIIKKRTGIIYYYINEVWQSIRTFFLLIKHNKVVIKERKIRVAYIVQMAEIWDKEEAVFELMKNDARFEVRMIVVPPYDMIKKSVSTDYYDNFFLDKYKLYAVRAYENGKWLDMKNKFDYVFYQRPYDHYLPNELQSKSVIKYSKCCYIPYGFSGADVFNGGNTNKDFFRNIYFGFLESDYMANLLKKKFHISRKLHHIENLGYPVLSPYYSLETKGIRCSLLWTPRWSFDDKIGGSTFLVNKNVLFNIIEEGIDCDLVFRPHPLLFEELVIKGMMSQKEISMYVNELGRVGVIYDHGEPIIEAINNASILITDFSSIIVQFFVTGKPIIYCEGGIKLNELFEKMLEGIYVAHNEKEIINFVKQINDGNDYLYNTRRVIIDKYLSNHFNSANRIVNRIVSDAYIE